MAATRKPFSWRQFFKRFFLISLCLIIVGGLIASVILSILWLPPTVLTVPLLLTTISNLPAVLLVTLFTTVTISNVVSGLYRLFWNAFPEWPTKRFFRHLTMGREGTRGDNVGWIGYLTNLSFVIKAKYGIHEQNPLMVAIQFEHGAETLNLLCSKRRALVTEQDLRGWTPMMYAAHYRYPGVVKILMPYIESSTHLKLHNKHGDTALLIAVKNSQYSFVSELLREAPDIGIDETDAQGNTALMQAVMRLDIKMVRLLLGTDQTDGCRAVPMQAANPHLKNALGKTALQLAKEKANALVYADTMTLVQIDETNEKNLKEMRLVLEIIRTLEAAEANFPKPATREDVVAALRHYTTAVTFSTPVPLRPFLPPSPSPDFSEPASPVMPLLKVLTQEHRRQQKHTRQSSFG